INGQGYTLIRAMAELDAIDGISAVDGSAVTPFGAGPSGRYALADDLAASGTTYIDAPVGSFGGTFAGLGHAITGLTIAKPTNPQNNSGFKAGLFASIGGGATVRDLALRGGTVSAQGIVGALAGESFGTVVATSADLDVSGQNVVGGLVGGNGGTILLSATSGRVQASGSQAGGIAGDHSGTIAQSSASGSVSADSNVGGLVGTQSGGLILQSFATGRVAGSMNVGGLAGTTQSGARIVESYATGPVSGGSFVGAFVGQNDLFGGATITSGAYDAQTTGRSAFGADYSQQSANVAGLATAQLQGTLPAGFTATVWGSGPGLYPYLKGLFPNGVQAVSGIAYKDVGATPASGSAGVVTVSLDAGGRLLGQTTAGANGYYYLALPAGTLATGTPFVASVPTNGALSTAAATLATSTYATATPAQGGVNLYGGALTVPTSAATLAAAPSLADARAATGGVASAATATLISGLSGRGFVTSAPGFTLDAAVDPAGTTVVQTGAGAPLAVTVPQTLTAVGSLGLISGGALRINASVTADGASSVGLAFDASDPTNLSFASGKSLTFAGTGGALAINGQPYTLVRTMADIDGIDGVAASAQAITDQSAAGGAAGRYALAGDLDAAAVSYAGALVTRNRTPSDRFSGTFEGLGHQIANLTLTNPPTSASTALFGGVSSTGIVRDLGLVGVGVTTTITGSGSLAGYNAGVIANVSATGSVSSTAGSVGGLVGFNEGSILRGSAAVTVSGVRNVGGLVGLSGTETLTPSTVVTALIADSAASGSVTINAGSGGGPWGPGGGLAGFNSGTVLRSSATGAVTGAQNTVFLGGLLGVNQGRVADTSASGSVAGTQAMSLSVGGLVGYNGTRGSVTRSFATGLASIRFPNNTTSIGGLIGRNDVSSVTASYWDTETTGQSSAVGRDSFPATAVGLTTRQFQGLDPLPDGGTITDSARLGAAFAGGANGLYPYLTSLFPNGVQAVSGTAFRDAGATPAASGASGTVTVSLDAGGSLLGQTTAGANGYYYLALPAGTLATGTPFVASVPTNGALSTAAATLATSTLAAGTSVQGAVNLYGGALTVPTREATLAAAPSLADARAATGSVASAATATLISGLSGRGFVTSAAGFTLDAPVDPAGTTVVQTGAGAPLTVTAAQVLNAGGSLGLLSGGSLRINENLTANGVASVTLAYAASDPTNLSFAQGRSLTFAGTGGALAINGQGYTLVRSMADLDGIDGAPAVSGGTVTNQTAAGGLSGRYALAGTLSATGTTYTDSLAGTDGSTPFSGTLEGLGHAITNLTISAGGTAGLFGYLSSGAVVRDVGLSGGSVSGGQNVGALAGYSAGGSIVLSYATGDVRGGSSASGGLVGFNAGSIVQSYATGSVSTGGSLASVGGLAGYNAGSIVQSYATGSVAGDGYIGGLVGQNTNGIVQSYATGDVIGGRIAGGLVGYNQGSIAQSSWDTEMTGRAAAAGGGSGSGATGLTTHQFQGLDPLPSGGSLTDPGQLGSAFAGGAGGLYPYLTSLFPTGIQAVSGVAYRDAGTTPAAGARITVVGAGTTLGSASSGANGAYYVFGQPGTILAGQGLVAYTTQDGSGASNAAALATATFASGTPAQTGMDIWGGVTLLGARTDRPTLSASGFDPATLPAVPDGATLPAFLTGAVPVLAATNPQGFTIDTAVTTGRSFGVQTVAAGAPLTVAAPVTIGGGGGLGLIAAGALAVNAAVTVNGAVPVVLGYDASDPTNLSFAQAKSLTFNAADGSATASPVVGQSLTINGAGYTLVRSMADLDAIDGRRATDRVSVSTFGPGLAGRYALAGDLFATTDGTATGSAIGYGTPVVGSTAQSFDTPAPFTGTVEGLGHGIGLVSIGAGQTTNVGLFGALGSGGTIRDLGLTGGSVLGFGPVGMLVGLNDGGTLAQVSASGGVSAQDTAGGLVGQNRGGTIVRASAAVTVSSVTGTSVGGLVGFNDAGSIRDASAAGDVLGSIGVGGLVGTNSGTILRAFASGAVQGQTQDAGGLVGTNAGAVSQAYATGAVIGLGASSGALIGNNAGGTVAQAYATGQVIANHPWTGGLIGTNTGTVADAYWDVATTGRTASAGGTGRVTADLQGALPGSFDAAAWETGPGLYPYLRSAFPNGVQAISGIAYADRGVTPLARPGDTNDIVPRRVFVDVGGTQSHVVTGANGAYYLALPAGTLSPAGTPVLAYTTETNVESPLQPQPVAGASLISATGTTGHLDVWSGTLIAPTSATTLSAAPTTVSGLLIPNQGLYAGARGGLPFAGVSTLSGVGYVATDPAGFTLDAAVPAGAAGGLFVRTTQGPIAVAQDQTLSGAGLSLYAAGSLAFAANVTATGAPVRLAYDVSSPTNLSFAPGRSLTFAGGGSLAINGVPYTLVRSMADLDGIDGAAAVTGGTITNQTAAGGLSGRYALAADVDAAGVTYAASPVSGAFAGTFEGLGHAIGGLSVTAPTTIGVGLFADLAGATVARLSLADARILGAQKAGVLAGRAEASTIAFVSTSGRVESVGLNGWGGAVGGLIGESVRSVVDLSRSDAAVVGAAGPGGTNGGIGGLIGSQDHGVVARSYALGSVAGAENVGGLVGASTGEIRDSFAMGAVQGGSFYTGGLVGGTFGPDGSVTRSYATGVVVGGAAVGALVGQQSGGSLTGSYWDGSTSGLAVGVGMGPGQGATGLSTAQFQSGARPSGLDPAVWGTGPGLYPYLLGFYPNGVQAISGTAYTDAGATLAASGAKAVKVSVDTGGTLLGQATTGANGYYYLALPAGTIGSGTSFMASVPTVRDTAATPTITYANAAATLATSTYAAVTPAQGGVNLYGGALTVPTTADRLSQAPSLTDARTSANAVASAGTLSLIAGLTGRGFVTSAAGFTLDNAVDPAGTTMVRTGAVAPITVTAAQSLNAGGSLGLLSGGSLAVNAPVTVKGAGAVALAYDASSVTNLSFSATSTVGGTGSVRFLDASGAVQATNPGNQTLTINGRPVALLYSMADVAGMSLTGASALAAPLTAATPYADAVAASGANAFTGTFTGLGNTIANLAITATGVGTYGLFGTVGAGGLVRDIGLTNAAVALGDAAPVQGGSTASAVGALAGSNAGTVAFAFSTGAVGTGPLSQQGALVGGLVGLNLGGITSSR
ncbi:GLUG motif-containing protein, partial [Methylobacterium aquaticum]